MYIFFTDNKLPILNVINFYIIIIRPNLLPKKDISGKLHIAETKKKKEKGPVF